MKTLNLHTNCSLPTLRNEWAGIRMFSTTSNPVAQLGKVDYISTKLEEASGWSNRIYTHQHRKTSNSQS